MFWRFGGYANISTIDTILDKSDFSLEELLDEGDLIQELKQHNAKLIDYLRDEPVLLRLLDYVVAPRLEPVASSEAQDDDDGDKGKGRVLPFSRPRASSRASEPENKEEEQEKKRNRYAYVAAEVLSSDNWSICEALLANKSMLRNFWDFLKRPTPLDPLQASYFTKVNEALFDKKTEEMIELLKSIDNAVPDMLRHVDCPMIMDLLLKIISLERTEAGQGIVEVSQSVPVCNDEAAELTMISFAVVVHPRRHADPPVFSGSRAQLGHANLGWRLHEGHHHRFRQRLPKRTDLHRPERAY